MKNAKTTQATPDPVDAAIARTADWRSETLTVLRGVIRRAHPDIVEEVKWRKPSNAMLGVAVWSSDGIICTGETYRDKVKLTFAKGALLEDPDTLFNSSLDGNTRRAIDIGEGQVVDARALRALVRAAIEINRRNRRSR